MNNSLIIGMGIGWACIMVFGYISGTVLVGAACAVAYFVKDD